TNDVEALAIGEGCYAALLDRKGKIRADMRVLRAAEDDFQIDTEREAGELVHAHLSMYKVGRDADVASAGAEGRLLSLLGPQTSQILGIPLSREHDHRSVVIAGAECRAVATDLGADLFVSAAGFDAVRAELLERGAEPIGSEAAEIARVEAGRPRLGHEIGPGTMPQEAGINDRAVSFTKGCYIGQETVARLHYKGKPNRHLRLLSSDALLPEGAPVSVDDREVGVIGTAVVSPARGPLALAILRREAEPGSEVQVGTGDAAPTARVEAIVELGEPKDPEGHLG
ncbi:MAG: folate-binding protein YgfZ, partial [Solirubrobacterales bacterium]|nr:folate-binding protein YgfZ [Solirubrobacterales bacterium]